MINFEFNLIPAIYKVLVGDLTIGSWVKIMLLNNILIFVPMGIFISLLFKTKLSNKSLICIFIIIPIIIEILQMYIGRSFDIDDIICNLLGIVIGYLFAKLFKRSYR